MHALLRKYEHIVFKVKQNASLTIPQGTPVVGKGGKLCHLEVTQKRTGLRGGGCHSGNPIVFQKIGGV